MSKVVEIELDNIIRSLKDAVATLQEPNDKGLELDKSSTYLETIPLLYGTLKGKVSYTARRLRHNVSTLETLVKHLKKLNALTDE